MLGSPIWSQVVDDWEPCVSAVSIMSTTHVGPFTIPNKMSPLVSSGFEIVAGSVAASQKNISNQAFVAQAVPTLVAPLFLSYPEGND